MYSFIIIARRTMLNAQAHNGVSILIPDLVMLYTVSAAGMKTRI